MEWPLIALLYCMASILNVMIMTIMFNSASEDLRELSIVFTHTLWNNSTEIWTGFIAEASFDEKLSSLQDGCLLAHVHEAHLVAFIFIALILPVVFCARQAWNFTRYSLIEDSSYNDEAVKEYVIDELLFWSIFIIQNAITAQLIQQPTTMNNIVLSTFTLTVAVRVLTSVNRNTADGSINLIGSIILLLVFTSIHFSSYRLTSRMNMSIFITNALLLTGLVVAHITDGEDTTALTVLHGKLSYVAINSCLINLWFWLIYSNHSTFYTTWHPD
jgi:hypothetical protein